jgi:hypothetical protein
MIASGVWWLKSPSDPRWDASGEGYVGGFVPPTACTKKIKELEAQLGKAPEDLEWGYMKD